MKRYVRVLAILFFVVLAGVNACCAWLNASSGMSFALFYANVTGAVVCLGAALLARGTRLPASPPRG